MCINSHITVRGVSEGFDDFRPRPTFLRGEPSTAARVCRARLSFGRAADPNYAGPRTGETPKYRNIIISGGFEYIIKLWVHCSRDYARSVRPRVRFESSRRGDACRKIGGYGCRNAAPVFEISSPGRLIARQHETSDGRPETVLFVYAGAGASGAVKDKKKKNPYESYRQTHRRPKTPLRS